MQHSRRKLDASPQTARKLLDEFFTTVGQSEPGQHFIRACSQFAPAQAIKPAMVNDVLHYRELLIDAGRLEHDAQLAANGKIFAPQVSAENPHFALLQRD